MEEKKVKKQPKPVKRSVKNVVKNLVKENQRIHDYKSPFGVKFWNKILKDSKAYAKNNKVFEKNVIFVIERDYERYNRLLDDNNTSPEQKEILKEKIYQLSFFKSLKWKDMFNEAARLKEEYKGILWKNRTDYDPYNVKKEK